MQKWRNHHSEALDSLIPGDICLLDRGFRDCIPIWNEKGSDVKMPAFVHHSQNRTQFKAVEAKKSRLVTTNRYGVETGIGLLEKKSKYFKKNGIILLFLIWWLMLECVQPWSMHTPKKLNQTKALSLQLECECSIDWNYWSAIGSYFLRCFSKSADTVRTILSFWRTAKINVKRPNLDFSRQIPNKAGGFLLPRTFQGQWHRNCFVRVHRWRMRKKKCADFFSDGGQPKLLMARLESRVRSNRSHDAYVLVDIQGEGESLCWDTVVAVATA